MGSLVKFELNKIIKRKSTYIIMLAAFLLLALLFFMSVTDCKTYDTNGNSYKGISAIKMEKENVKLIPSVLTNDVINQSINEVKQNYIQNFDENSESKMKTFNKYFLPRKNYFKFILTNYLPSFDPINFPDITQIDNDSNSDFYKVRFDTIKSNLESDNNKYSPAEKTFWLKKATNSSGPYNYGFYRGWSSICNEFSIFILFMLGICIAIAPVYNCEYQSGIDSILLASKYGKNKLNLAKIIASFIFGIGSLIVALTICFGIILTFFGTDGWNLPIQLMGSTIAYPFNFLQLALIMVGLLLVATLALISLTLFLSAKFKNPTSVLAIDFLVIFLPQFLHMSKISIISKLISLTPYQILHPMYDNFISYAIGNIIFDYFTFAFLIYFLVLLIATPLAIKAFKNHQVG